MTGPRDIFERQQQTILDYDMEGQAALFAEDGVMEFPFAPEGFPRRLDGREQIATVLTAAAEPLRESGRRLIRYRNVVVHETADPEVIIVEFVVDGEERDGTPFALPYIQVWRVRDGRIVSLRDYWSAATAPVGRLNKELVRRHLEAWSDGDPTEVLAADWIDHAHPKITGLDQVRAVRERIGKLQITLDEIIAEGDLVAFRRTVEHGGRVTHGMGFVRVADGKLAEQWTLDR